MPKILVVDDSAVERRLVTGLLVGVEPSDPATLSVVTAFLATAALLACYLPARRAARIEPSTLLRSE